MVKVPLDQGSFGPRFLWSRFLWTKVPFAKVPLVKVPLGQGSFAKVPLDQVPLVKVPLGLHRYLTFLNKNAFGFSKLKLVSFFPINAQQQHQLLFCFDLISKLFITIHNCHSNIKLKYNNKCKFQSLE